MDAESRKFLSQVFDFICPKCEKIRHFSLKELGKKNKCINCGHIVCFSSELNIDSSIDEEFVEHIKEYLKEIKNSSH